MKVTVRINGTGENPWARYGLRCNPFPKIAKAEYADLNEVFRRLDSEPIPSEAHLRRLLGEAADELGADKHSKEYQQLVAACVANYRPGERTAFYLTVGEP